MGTHGRLEYSGGKVGVRRMDVFRGKEAHETVANALQVRVCFWGGLVRVVRLESGHKRLVRAHAPHKLRRVKHIRQPYSMSEG